MRGGVRAWERVEAERIGRTHPGVQPQSQVAALPENGQSAGPVAAPTDFPIRRPTSRLSSREGGETHLGAVAAGHALGAAFIRRLLAARAHHTPRQPSVSTEPRLAPRSSASVPARTQQSAARNTTRKTWRGTSQSVHVASSGVPVMRISWRVALSSPPLRLQSLTQDHVSLCSPGGSTTTTPEMKLPVDHQVWVWCTVASLTSKLM
eukprot:3603149-Rhodomonas_salina.5